MSQRLSWSFLAMVLLAMSASLPALNYEVGGCKTGSGYVNFTTISAAVAGVPADSKILVCPGAYPEQVTITQPLTLQGIGSGNSNRAVIAINPTGDLAPNVTSIIGQGLYAQVLVQNVNPSGPVNITGITVDGGGGNVGCSMSVGLVGIFYAAGTSGTINEVTTRNHQSSGCGNSIWAENTAGATQITRIENSSVRNFDNWGITALSDQSTSTLTAIINANFINPASSALAVNAEGMVGSISNNVVTSAGQGILTEAYAGPITVSGNTVADVIGGYGMFVTDGTTATSNKMSNMNDAFNFPDGGATVKSNIVMNATGAAFDLGCFVGSTISANIVNDSQFGFQYSRSLITGNSLYNVDTIQSGSCP
jgi:hypothetical protein